MRLHPHRPSSGGFTLIEMMVALVIMAIIGLMAWRGLDSLLRGKERIEFHSAQQRDIHYALTLLDRDCRLMVRQADLTLPPVALGSRNVWWMRQSSLTEKPAWQIVGYRVESQGLVRMLSSTFRTREQAIEVWKKRLSSPDSDDGQIERQALSGSIVAQTVTALSDMPNQTIPIRGMRFVWQLAGNQTGGERPITRTCLSGGF